MSEEEKQPKISDEDKLKEFEETLDKISVSEIILGMVATLNTLAYKKLGIPDEDKQDLDEASLAIDSIGVLLEALEKSGKLSSDDIAAFQASLSSLRMTFASLKK